MTNANNKPAADGLAPFSQEAEQSVIGAVLVNANAFLPLSAVLKPEDFYFVKHGYIWSALERIAAQNDRIDFVTITDELRKAGKLDDIGGQAYLLSLANNTPSSMHSESYARIVERAAIRRRLLVAADTIKDLARDETLTTDQVVASAEKATFAVTSRTAAREISAMPEMVQRYFARTEYLYEHPEQPRGLSTGFREIDARTGGLQRGDLLIFAGRPGMGKTSWLLSLAMNAASLYNARVLIFTMEMGQEQLVQRFFSMETGIDSKTMRSGQLTPPQWSRFVRAAGILPQWPIFIDDSATLTPTTLKTKAQRVQHEHGLDLIIVDYVQLMNDGSRDGGGNRVQEMSVITRSLKELARNLHVPVVAAAQLSRAVEQRQDKRPMMSDLRESGSLENDADIVAFAYRDSVYNPECETPNKTEIIFAKHRNGATGTDYLYFDNAVTRFTDYKAQTVYMGNGTHSHETHTEGDGNERH